MNVIWIDRQNATLDTAPNVRIKFAENEDETLIEQVLGILVHATFGNECEVVA